MRRSDRLDEKQEANLENEPLIEPQAKKSRSDIRTPNIATMDNDTLVEAFKYLNYMQLAKNSLVSKRFWNLIRTHRHSLALLYVPWITMALTCQVSRILRTDLPAFIEIFSKSLSAKEYSEWVVRSQYSRQIPYEGGVARKKFYHLMAFADYNADGISNFRSAVPKRVMVKDRMTVLNAYAELNHQNWPLFQHFVRLITDPFIYICTLELTDQNDVLNWCRVIDLKSSDEYHVEELKRKCAKFT
ncbi:hypothetical protein Ddc_16541 [Ditylenchus destructor]|nr:hypothetical protein Ddc_16541 [Ditylenchus destructor]